MEATKQILEILALIIRLDECGCYNCQKKIQEYKKQVERIENGTL